ncbi:BYS1 domain [Pyrenophora seminiperda CCB06]|uniref:BYS1 domain n=1 Tax=Pyrenophora seminiperda CCB06 TaxID=1302712 RepID=A0A3M7M587_9PLEO|nr:BYS1 domain [Pyrenophora seminiperda CCB06]
MLLNAIAIVSLITGAQAVGRAIVTNQCDAPIYLWSVGGSIDDQTVIAKDQSYSETFTKGPKSGGVALKITTVEGGIFKPSVSQTIFAYNLDINQVWYDMSDMFGDGFAGRTMTLKPKDPACQSIDWYGGKPTGGSEVKKAKHIRLTNLTIRLTPNWTPCGNAAPDDSRNCCTHCIGGHHCVAAP